MWLNILTVYRIFLRLVNDDIKECFNILLRKTKLIFKYYLNKLLL